MDRKVLIVVSISVLGSWLFDSAVIKLVSRLSIVDKLSCGSGEVKGVCAGLEVATEYVIVEFCRGEVVVG